MMATTPCAIDALGFSLPKGLIGVQNGRGIGEDFMRLTFLFAMAAMLCAFAAGISLADEPLEPEPALSEAELSAAIDHAIDALHKRDGVKRAPPVSDHEFVRRVYLDVTGMPPTAEEAQSFLKDKSKHKREALIDALVDDRRFAEHLADQWLTVLTGRGRSIENADLVLGAWMAQQIHEGAGFDRIIHEILSAQGRMSENPAAAYYAGRREIRAADLAGEASRHFMGVQIQCAECHDHPYEADWKESDFNGVASFFAPLQVRRPGDIRPRQGEVVDRPMPRIDPQIMARRMERAQTDEQRLRIYQVQRYRAPRFLGGEAASGTASSEWRAQWAQWVVSDQNDQTRRYLANRLWSFLFGLGFVDPADDFNSLNEPSHPELLELLAADLLENQWDVRRFYRAVLKSRTWQSASSGATRESGPVENWYFAQYPVRQLSPEQLFGALLVIQSQSDGGQRRINALPNPFQRMATAGAAYERRREAGNLPPNQRVFTYDFEAIQALSETIGSMSPEWFARRTSARNYARVSTDDEETEVDGFSVTIDQALLLLNGTETARIATAGRGTVLEHLLSGEDSVNARIERMFLLVLSRPPSNQELRRYRRFLRQQESSREAWEDAVYSLLLSVEFLTNH
jgi:hypothetical protein